jgi:hypothetical protein
MSPPPEADAGSTESWGTRQRHVYLAVRVEMVWTKHICLVQYPYTSIYAVNVGCATATAGIHVSGGAGLCMLTRICEQNMAQASANDECVQY